MEQCEKAYKEGEKHPSGYELSKRLNAIKKIEFPWMYEVTKWAPQRAIHNLASAFKKFFQKQSRYPKFKRKGGSRESFYLGLNNFRINGCSLYIPKMGSVRMAQKLRFPGRPLSVVISKSPSGKYYASIQVQLDSSYVYPHGCESQAVVGIDLGVKYLVVLSDGTKFANPKVLKFFLSKLKRLQRSLSRKQKGSRNRDKARMKLARCHDRIRSIRLDLLHKITAFVVNSFKMIGVEDLHTSGMLKNHKLAQSIQDASFYKIRRQLEYKAKLSGSEVVLIDRWYPSSKTCSICGWKKEDLQLADREWRCEGCGIVHDRDINAAQNILKVALGHRETENACGENRRRRGKTAPHSSVKQEGGNFIMSSIHDMDVQRQNRKQQQTHRR